MTDGWHWSLTGQAVPASRLRLRHVDGEDPAGRLVDPPEGCIGFRRLEDHAPFLGSGGRSFEAVMGVSVVVPG